MLAPVVPRRWVAKLSIGTTGSRSSPRLPSLVKNRPKLVTGPIEQDARNPTAPPWLGNSSFAVLVILAASAPAVAAVGAVTV